MIHRLLAIVALLSLGACDGLGPPEPTNPYDAAFEGRRITSPPSDVRVTETSSTSVTLEWTRESTYGSGYRIEARTLATSAPPPPLVHTLPADATRFELDFPDTATRQIQIVGLGAPAEDGRPAGQESIPADTITVAFSASATPISRVQPPLQPTSYSGVRFGPQGTAFYTGYLGFLTFVVPDQQFVIAIDPETGGRIWTYQGAHTILDVLEDGRVVAAQEYEPDMIHVLSATGERLRVVQLKDYDGCSERTVRVTEDGERAGALCSNSQIGMWDLRTGERTATIGTGVQAFHDFGAEGAVVFVRQASRLRALDAATGQLRWSRPESTPSPIALTVDRRSLATVERGTEPTLVVLDADTGRPSRSTPVPNGNVNTVQFSPSGSTILYGLLAPTFERFTVVDAATLEPLRDFQSFDSGLGTSSLGRIPFAATDQGAVGLKTQSGGPYQFIRWDVNGQWEVASPE